LLAFSAVVGLLTNNHNAGRLLVKTPTAAMKKNDTFKIE
jgi:hypothetical protein